MTKYTADEYELRVATTETGLVTAEVLVNWDKFEIATKVGRKKYPVGIGSKLKEVKSTLIDYDGSASGWVDESDTVAGATNLLTLLGMYSQSTITPLFFRLTNKTNGKTVTVKKAIGDPVETVPSAEEVTTWSWDFSLEDISNT